MRQIGYFNESAVKEMDEDVIRLGTVNLSKSADIDNKQNSLNQKKTRLETRANKRYEIVEGRDLFGNPSRQFRKKHFFTSGEKVVYDNKGKKHRIFFKEMDRYTGSEEDYRAYLINLAEIRQRNRRVRHSAYQTGRRLFDDGHLQDDEYMADFKRKSKRFFNESRRNLEHGVRSIKLQNNDFTRLRTIENKQQLLEIRKERLQTNASRNQYRESVRSASSRYQKQKLKKEMVSAIRQKEGNWVQQIKAQFFVKKKSTGEKIRAVKRILSTILSLGIVGVSALALLAFGIMVFISLADGFGRYGDNAITQNDYGTLSSGTAYLKKLETDLEEYFLNKEELQLQLEADYGPDLYEFIYEMPELGFQSTTLMAYLSAKYGTFTLEQVKEELDLIFAEMYKVEIEVLEEARRIEGEDGITEELKKICYVRVIKRELEEIVQERMTQEEKERYGTYKLSSGGQQIYGPVMVQDWTELISSDYGERIHPVTGERTFHNGVDVAIPTGTKLYSAVSGTVTVAQYSDTAGNYIRVQTDSGWVVTFMHMDSLAVTPGQVLEKGDFVGYSGNTGRSTGPHLHLEVRDSDNNPVNPVFIVPQNTYRFEEETT